MKLATTLDKNVVPLTVGNPRCIAQPDSLPPPRKKILVTAQFLPLIPGFHLLLRELPIYNREGFGALFLASLLPRSETVALVNAA